MQSSDALHCPNTKIQVSSPELSDRGSLPFPKGEAKMKKLLGLSILAVVAVLPSGLARSQNATPIRIPVGQNTLEFVGQFNNTPTTSQQFGYLSKIEGVDSIFFGSSVQ